MKTKIAISLNGFLIVVWMVLSMWSLGSDSGHACFSTADKISLAWHLVLVGWTMFFWFKYKYEPFLGKGKDIVASVFAILLFAPIFLLLATVLPNKYPYED
jgi:hypothetical protein